MDRVVTSLVLLLLAIVASSSAQEAVAEPAAAPATPAPAVAIADGAPQRLYYDVGRNLSLTCNLPKESDLKYVWSKNGTTFDKLKEVTDRFEVESDGAKIKVRGRSLEDDFGNYTCAVGSNSQSWEVRGRPHPKLPANTNVVEEQKIKIACKVTGKPYPEQVTWWYNNDTDASASVNNTGFLMVVESERVKLQPGDQNITNAELIIEKSQRSDAGLYMCLVKEEGISANATTVLRVKDMYAALWPFLGICAEVFVLCAIILVYEKRRTKPELDDSDTDNHDQKKS